MSRSRRRSHRLRRVLVPAALLAGGAAIARGVARRRPLIEPVSEDLRSPLLYLPLNLRSERVLQAIRSMPIPPMGGRPDVSVESRSVTADDGRSVRVVCYERRDRSRPSAALVWIHGGGMVLGVPEQGGDLCNRWADELDLFVV